MAEHRLSASATAADLRQLERRVDHRQFEAGSTIVRRGDAAVECCTLSAAAFAVPERRHRSLVIRLMRNLMRNLMRRMNETTVRLTAEVAALGG